MVDTLYVVMCGAVRVKLEELPTDEEATAAALEHDRIHHCSPWVQYPLEHVHQADA